MNKSQFEAGTFGVGELITQRKLFRVPAHQRSYAWNRDAVTTFLADVGTAFDSNAAEYFIGLVVIQGPEDGEWVLLDGQQRLTTSTMLFAAVRNWLSENNLFDDARQIETEFLGVRRLGGDYSSRMQLNEENQATFKAAVIEPTSSSQLKSMQALLAKKSSNRLLVDAARECQEWTERMSNLANGAVRDRAERLFRLSAFLESKVKVVCVEISNDVDPYILFESLNDRGVELSALDLLKNYAFSKSTSSSKAQFEHLWARLVALLNDRNPDDFLKVSWTASHGLVQKTQLFRNIRGLYRSQGELLTLLELLGNDARILAALDDPEDALWSKYPAKTRNHVHTLNMLGGRQVRSVALAAMSHLEPEGVETMLHYLIVVTVRFQIVGRGRTGVMEKVFGKLCEDISSRAATSAADFRLALKELWVEDEVFTAEFAEHKDSKLGRFAYFLAQLELTAQPDLKSIQSILAESTLTLLSHSASGQESDEKSIGEFALLEPEMLAIPVAERANVLRDSKFKTTRSGSWPLEVDGEEVQEAVRYRAETLAHLASAAWSF